MTITQTDKESQFSGKPYLATNFDVLAVNCILDLFDVVPPATYSDVLEILLLAYSCEYAEIVAEELKQMYWDCKIESDTPLTINTLI